MARVKIEDIVYRLDSEFKKALEDTFRQFCPNAEVNRSAAFSYFLNRVHHHCSTWETVPDSSVEL